jgi:hypothetical protein
MDCPEMVVQLYKGLLKIYTNPINMFEGSTTVVKHMDKDPAAGLEIPESFIL